MKFPTSAVRNSLSFQTIITLILLVITIATMMNQSIVAASEQPMCTSGHAKSGKTSAGCFPADLQEGSDQINPSHVQPLFGQSNGSGTEAITSPDFTYRHNWGSRNGQAVLTLYSTRIYSYSRVLVSASELDPINPFMGSARYTVHNVVPFDGGVKVWITIDWSQPVQTQLTYLVLNS